jgi:NAD(P)-dependent dehydrogenase (short-subunit alcohol dehydrogenase family)
MMAAVGKNLVGPDSVVLVSGGGRGITARCVVELARRVACKFILLGRTPPGEPLPDWATSTRGEPELKKIILENMKASGESPTPQKIQKAYKNLVTRREVEETLAAIRQAGGQAEYVSVDITNAAELKEKLAAPVARLGKITGIIHGAGNLADKRIEKKTMQDFETVFSAKVDGLENLLHVTPVSQLDFLVLFSSVVGVYGNIGQADYAIANEILNKTALLLKQHYPNCHVVSIDWGPWEAGMVTPELKKAFEERGVEVIPVEVGARMLVRELMPQEAPLAQVVMGKFPSISPETLQPELKQYQIHRKISLESNPFLLDHRIGEKPVLPATCAATWIVNAAEQLYPGYKFLNLRNYRVLKGIVFDDNSVNEYILELKETVKSPDGQVDFDALIWSTNNRGRQVFHYSAGISLVANLPETPVLPLPDISDPGDLEMDGQDLYQDGTLFHGPSFQGVERVLHISRDRLVMQLCLPRVEDRIQGQFPVQNKSNPYIYDAIVQILLIWTQVYQKAPCLPSSLERMEQYENIPFGEACLVSMQIRSCTDLAVVGDIMAQSPDGKVYVKFHGLLGTVSPLLNRLIGARNPVEIK